MTSLSDQSVSPAVPTSRPFAAAHSGDCVTCRARFDLGDLIERAPGGWRHENCGRAAVAA